MFASVRLLLLRQYAFLHHKFLTEEPKVWRSTFVSLLLGAWIFVFGLVGLLDEKRRKRLRMN